VGVWINFMPAPILAIAFQNGYQQINIQIPWEGARDPLYVEVFQGSNRARLESAYTNNGFHPATGWSVFLTDPSGHANLRHASDYSLVTQNNPAHAGEDVIAYGINLGPVKNTPRSGYHAPGLSAAFDPSAIGIEVCAGYDTIMIGNTPVQPTYDGLAAGLTGVYQVNFRVPPGLFGELPLAIQRTLVVFPLGACRPDQQHINETTASASALLSVR
jgi:uncharacterized protein (TIGR03437 family)